MFDVTPVTGRAGRAAVALLLVLATAASACSPDDGAGGTGGSDADRDGEATTTTTAGEGPYATGVRVLTLVDDTRTTDAVPGVLDPAPTRTIETQVVYPAEGPPGPAPEGASLGGGTAPVDAPPAAGAFPLVVFAHGHNGRGEAFRGHAETWARAGYVVALPTFPLSRAGVGVADDLVHQPGDVSFVIDELTDPGGDTLLAGHVDAERVAVGGHSLGAATVFGVAYNSCCLDARVDAAITVSGGSLPFAGGDYDDRPATPMLLVHGVRDAAVPVGAGDAMFELATGPTWYLRPSDADHVGVFLDEPGALLDDAVVAFLDAELRGDDAALDAVGADVEAGGRAEWRVKPAT